MHRSFTIIGASGAKGSTNLGGRFISKTPVGAARKAASRICRESAIRGVCTLEIHIQETTRGGSGKVFMYKVSRKLNPREVERNGKIIKYKYTTIARSL